MPPTPRIDVYLELAIIALKKLPRFVNQRPLQAYLADDYFQSAVERQLEIAGDALAQIRKNGPDLFKLIPDGDLIVGFRNVLAHGHLIHCECMQQRLRRPRSFSKYWKAC
jgi:uncharacterized protein with HEPN domain